MDLWTRARLDDRCAAFARSNCTSTVTTWAFGNSRYARLLAGSTCSPRSLASLAAVAMSITAFPVLARILTERKLYPTTVGIATISAAAVDDAAAWCLLALVVSIVNSTSPLVALYTFLCAVGWALLVLFGLRPLLKRVVKWSATRHASNVSESLVFTMFALVMLSSFVTEMIGVHAIFGAFLIGLATPHEDGCGFLGLATDWEAEV